MASDWVTAFYHGLTASVDKGREFIIYPDFLKASDRAPHNLLAAKLENYGFDGKIIRCKRNWLNGHIQEVAVNGLMSKWRLVMGDGPQGSILTAAF